MLPEFAHSLYQSFEREGIPLLLAGGWAVCHHGYTRYTNDIESLLAMKLHALKDDKERDGRDLLDIRLLLKENKGVMTEKHLREICERFAGPDAYNLIRMIP